VTRLPDFDDLIAGPAPVAETDARAAVSSVRTTVTATTGSRLDTWWAGVLRSPARRRLWDWAGPVAVVLLAAWLRLFNLANPRSLVFDETYYVKDAYTLMRLGYEGEWPADADVQFNAGNVDVFTTAGEYIAHPPLGKWIISLGLQVYGADDPFGWRIATAVVGILAVALVCVIAKALFSSTLLATIAGGLMAIDGLAIVMSRTALLDNSLMLLTLLGVGAILLDRRQSADALARWISRRERVGLGLDWGPGLWNRPWLVTAGVLFGLASAVKWSGLYFLAFFAIYTLAVDAVARRRAGIRAWLPGTLMRQGPVSFLLLVPAAAAAYVATWTGWLVTSGGYGRDYATATAAASGAPTPSWASAAVQSFWHYQNQIYDTNVALSTPHSYQANPVGWLLMLRPTVLYYRGSTLGQNGCRFDACAEFISTIANPLLWWLAVASALYLVVRFATRREWRVGLILMGVAAGYLPWLLYTDRTVFQFYTIVFLPYLVLALTFVLGLVLGRRGDPARRRRTGIRIVAVVLLAIGLVSVFFWSAWSDMQIPTPLQQLHYWLPGWL
jgi:dolichyl-phosphate-mannose-protein mannosyltransferase